MNVPSGISVVILIVVTLFVVFSFLFDLFPDPGADTIPPSPLVVFNS
ncbi:hypothetical protein [Shouchella lonarensis]|uniref:Uncharacterized protein n=1 Tax=Shouchella lonarensis TaxID=1464122 RepID=A0A1G6GL50_9BACI|nr:hypothetical protein [Shouchella lonarensis]SDB82654.1 hypothetical protein SAMN05421737_101204 [Shouchella lonarensis]